MAVVLQNARGQRVDSPLSYYQLDFLRLKDRKLCNGFHLLDRCSYLENNGRCLHDHDEKLSEKQIAALRAVARQTPCPWGLYCSDRDCLCGHRCPRSNCLRKTCRFPMNMHDVDTNIVS
jgi:hypothetical protein